MLKQHLCKCSRNTEYLNFPHVEMKWNGGTETESVIVHTFICVQWPIAAGRGDHINMIKVQL